MLGFMFMVCAIGICINITISTGYIAGTGTCRQYTKHFLSIKTLPPEEKELFLISVFCEISQTIDR